MTVIPANPRFREDRRGNPTAALDALSFSRIPTFVGTGAGMRGHDGFGAYNDQFANNIL